MFSHKKFNSSDSVNTQRNVSLQIALIAFWAYTNGPFKSRLNVFCLPVDALSFRHNFATTLTVVRQNLTLH